MESLLTKIAGRFFGLFRFLEADPEQLRAIVSLKLKTDNRRQHVSYRTRSQQEPRRSFLITIVAYGFLGVIPAFFATALHSFLLGMVIYYAYFIIMIVLTMVTDFSSILLDTSDNTIILPRPVSGRTLYIARLIHILLYLGQLSFGLCIAPAIAVGYTFGVGILIPFLVLTVLAILMALLITNAAYLLIMRVVSEERLRTIINYFQIVMTVLLMSGYQIFLRSAGIDKIGSTEFEVSWWHLLLPPVWLAAPLEMVHTGVADIRHIVMTLCGLIIPVAGLYLVTVYLTPLFNKKLGVLVVDKKGGIKKPESANWLSKISRVINRTPVERASFELVYRLFSRDRKMKLKVYPTIGYMLVLGIAWSLNNKAGIASLLEHPQQSKYHVALFYLPFLLMQVALHEIPYSDDFKASWVYFSAPFSKPGEVLSGMVKAMMMRLILPFYGVISIAFLAIWGIQKIDEVIFGLLNNYLMTMTVLSIRSHYLPFSMSPDVRNQSGDFLKNLFGAIIITVMAFGHYLLSTKPVFLDAMILVQLIVAIYLHQAYRKITWNDITL